VELVTGSLNNATLLGCVPDIAAWYLLFGMECLVVEYGWGSDQQKLWTAIDVNVEGLTQFVARSVDEGGFVPGSSDLLISDRLKTLQFRLCHESDIHVESDNLAAMQLIERQWSIKGIQVYTVKNGKRQTGNSVQCSA